MKRILPGLTMMVMASVMVLPVTALPNTQVDLPGSTADRGKALWNQERTVSGQARSCASCHTSDPRQTGKHVRTGKPIKPMAPAVNSERFTDSKKVAKWFKRNCKWTLGRECNAQEKNELSIYLKNL
jgi:hypothetical protein